MCGIVGFIDLKHNTDEKTLNKMRDTLVHRGPDAYGSSVFKEKKFSLGLAHRRLSILDLSTLGNQPMEFEHLTITYNGEVYNFIEIKKELQNYGYNFDSNSDTEVILKAFHKWGVKAVERFRGMFVFAIYDKKIDKLFIFRDRAGVKPLYYYKKDDIFLFASELKAFHKHPKFYKTLNQTALPYYFRFGYIPTPLSIFEDTYKLRQGHYIELNCKTLQYNEIAYWKIENSFFKQKVQKNETDILQELEEILCDSFKLRMVSDVPVGVFLSGGVDSTLVTALLQKDRDKPLKTFTIGFSEKDYNEAKYAKDIANYLQTEHTEYYCSSQDMLELVKELPYIYDEPFGDSSAIPTLLVSKIAKKHVKVVLSGDGGDESFIGYSKYFALDKFLTISDNKKLLAKIITTVLTDSSVEKVNDLLPYNKRQKNIKDKFNKFKNAINSKDNFEMFFNASSYVDNNILDKVLIHNNIDIKNSQFDIDKRLNTLNHLDLFSLIDYQTFMADDVLVKVDRASMAMSLEAREPLLDHKIIEYMAQVPIDIKYKNHIGKYLLKQILYKYIPKQLIERPKSGFQIPLNEWLKDDLKDLLNRYLNKKNLDKSGIYNVDYIIKLKQDLFAGKSINLSLLWFILIFEMWKEKWEI